MAVLPVNEATFVDTVLRSELPVLVEFGAKWCGPCKSVAPELDALERELEGKARIVTVDIDDSPALARELGVLKLPTFVVFHEGRPAGGRVGAMKRAALRELLEPLLPRPAGALKPGEVAQLLKAGQVTLIDTREPAVFARAHLPGAVNIPLDSIESRLAELHMQPGAPVVYCRAGDQTRELSDRLAASGMEVPFLEGGVLGWESEGFELERPD